MAEEEPEEGAEPEEKAKPAGSPFRYLFLILVVLAAEGAGAYFLLNWAVPPREDVVEEEAEEETWRQQEVVAPLYYEDLKGLVLAPAPAQSGYLVKLSLALEVFPGPVIEELAKRHEFILDTILQALETYPIEAFRDPHKKGIKKGLIPVINKELKNGEVRAIFFTELVIQ